MRRCAVLGCIVLLQPLQTACLASGINWTPIDRTHLHRLHFDCPAGCTTRPRPHHAKLSSPPMSLRVPRGGGTNKATAQPEENAELKKAHEALDSAKLTYRWCFVSFVTSTLITFIDKDLRNKPFTWLVGVEILNSLYLGFFGYGLWKVMKLYGKDFASNKPMSYDTISDLCNNMARIWHAGAWNLVAVSFSKAATLRQQLGWPPGPGTFSGPIGVVVVAALGSFFIRRRCAHDAASAIANEQEGGGPVELKAEKTRALGFLTCRNMALCIGAFSLMGVFDVTTWMLKPASLVSRFFAITDAITPFAIARLQLSLYRGFLGAIMNVTGKSSPGSKIDVDLLNELYEAQTGFYSKVGETLRSVTIFRMLPYAFAPIQPYVLAVSEKVLSSFVSLEL